ncbi:molybdopterin molybdotransferase MoeA [Sphingosinicella sp. BN140058]|uniref:molybdopterin molybdotransferase MoeA n=1 Tax=Sphingosinicella sp. BN140058 TaxID=1892855 RepID=UPI0010122E20|nr:molybdopterin molybdotransferase MoeA [Sphingosinicella sp. BN140058]QAY79439.1 molybdopterin molybdenumtransferase MoeA [Sphingosinicella sp. BN140058]
MIALDEALAIVAGVATPLGTETIGLEHAAGRVLAAPVRARIDGPRFDVSTMDGYAVRESDFAARPCSLRVIGEAFPGAPFAGAVASGTCVRIFTGAALPSGSDRVVMQEIVRREGDQALFEEPQDSLFVRRKASDFGVGDVLVAEGRALDARSLVAAAAADLSHVDVVRRPRLLIVGTGDELVLPGEAAATPAAIPESISLGLAALAAEAGAEIVGRRMLPDDLATMQAAMTESLGLADVVVVTGGASVGARDFAKNMFGDLDILFSKVAIKPGKPVWLGRTDDALVVGLPGNPTSALVTARLLLRPLLDGLGGRPPTLAWRRAVLAGPMEQGGDRETFWRGQAVDGKVVLVPNQDSGAQKTLAEADLLVRQAVGQAALAAGSAVDVLDF